MKRDTKSGLVRRIAAEYGCNHSTKYFVDKCKALGEDVSPALAHAVLGPYRYRAKQDTKAVINASHKLLEVCDHDVTMAVRCLKIHR